MSSGQGSLTNNTNGNYEVYRGREESFPGERRHGRDQRRAATFGILDAMFALPLTGNAGRIQSQYERTAECDQYCRHIGREMASLRLLCHLCRGSPIEHRAKYHRDKWSG